MKKLVIQGGKKLYGTINISGSKNASLPILAASLLIDEVVTLKNIPNVKDILTMIVLLENIGKKIEFRAKKTSTSPAEEKKEIVEMHDISKPITLEDLTNPNK